MPAGNQTLLLSGSLLSNAATELAQTLRADLLQLLDQPVSNLNRYGLTDACISALHANGFAQVQDLNFLQIAHLRTMGFPAGEVPLLTEICNEVRRTISVGSLSKILRNASENITEIAATLPIKNTFIDFPTLFAQQPSSERHPHSCPAFFLEEERKAIAELEASIKQQQSAAATINRRPEQSRGASEHGTGNCKPCAWFHHVEGCRHAQDCEFCHLCPSGEIKKRKKDKQKLIRIVKAVGDNDPIGTPDNDDIIDTLLNEDEDLIANCASAERSSGGVSSWLGSIFAK